MYVTYFNSGEQRERGIELLHLKNTYQQSGFLPTEKELPDYLPLMLEFAAIAEIEAARSVFEKYLSNVRELASRLEKMTAYTPGCCMSCLPRWKISAYMKAKKGLFRHERADPLGRDAIHCIDDLYRRTYLPLSA